MKFRKKERNLWQYSAEARSRRPADRIKQF
jgi:hypothetical protein